MDKTPRKHISISTKTILRFWLVPLAIVAAVLAVRWALPALVMIFVAFFLAVVLNRPTVFLAKYIKSRSASAIIALAGLILVTVLAFYTVVPLFAKQTVTFVSSLPNTFSQLQQSSDEVYEFLRDHGLEEQYTQVVDSAKSGIVSMLSNAAQNVVGLFGGLLNALIVATLVVVMTLFMLIEGPMWTERFWRLAYTDKARREHHQGIAEKMYHVVTGYINGAALLGLMTAIVCGLAVFVATLVAPVPIDVVIPSMLVMFVCAFIPMFGSPVSGTVVSLLLLLYSWPAALIFAAYFIIFQQIQNNIFVPKIFAKRVNISNLMVLIAVVIGTYCGGFLGILISIPAAGCLQILIREIIVRKKLSSQDKVEKEKDAKKLAAKSESPKN